MMMTISSVDIVSRRVVTMMSKMSTRMRRRLFVKQRHPLQPLTLPPTTGSVAVATPKQSFIRSVSILQMMIPLLLMLLMMMTTCHTIESFRSCSDMSVTVKLHHHQHQQQRTLPYNNNQNHHQQNPTSFVSSLSSSRLRLLSSRRQIQIEKRCGETEVVSTPLRPSPPPLPPPPPPPQPESIPPPQSQRQQSQRQQSQQLRFNDSNAKNNVSFQQQQQQQQEWNIERQISIAGRQGRTDDAIQLFHSILINSSISSISSPPVPVVTIRQLNAVIDACARGRPVRLQTALELLNTYTTANIQPHRPLSALQQQRSLRNTGTTPTTATTALSPSTSLLSSGSTTTSSRIGVKLEPNVYTYGALMNAISRLGEIDFALQVLQYMQHPTNHITNNDTSATIVRPNVVVYQSAITAAANAARPDVAWQLLDDAKRNQIAITVIGYNAAITAAARANNYTLAIDLLRQMQQSQQSPQSLNDTTTTTTTTNTSATTLPAPDIVTYGTVMAACEHCNQWQLVLQFAQEIENSTITDGSDSGTSAPATTTIISSDDTHPSGKNSNSNSIYLDGMAITSALKACQQLGYASLAIHYLDQMKLLMQNDTNSMRPYATTSQSSTTSGRERIGSKQPLQGPDGVAYRLAISACARGGAWQDGIRLLDEYCQTVNDHDVVAYTAAITGCEYAGRWIEAVQLLIRMRQVANVQPNVVTFAAVIGACATACAQLMNDSTTSTTTTSNNNYYNSAGSSRSSVHINGEMPLPQKKALQILNIMKKDPNVIDPNIQVYNAAIRTCAEAMDIKRAFQLYQMIQDNDDGDRSCVVQPNVITYGTLMLACERVGSTKGMDQVFAQMRTNQIRPNEIIYGTAISCCRKAGDKDRAYTLLNKMLHDGYQPNVATINTVLIAQTENMSNNNNSGGGSSTKSSNSDVDRAVQIFKTFLLTPSSSSTTATTTTAMGTPVLPSRQSYSIMIRAFASNQRPKDAEALLRRMRSSDGMIPDVDLYTMTVSAYERNGQPLNALRLMESMREDGYDFYDVEVLNALFKRLVKLVNALGQTLGKGIEKSSNISTTSIL